MKAFTYVNPTNEKEALAALATAQRGRMLPMAGGMDLLGLMKDYIVSPDRVVSIKGLDSAITAADGGLRIGAASKIVDLAEHASARTLFPALVSAAEHVGTPQIRNMGTVCGTSCRSALLVLPNEEFIASRRVARCFEVEGETSSTRILRRRPLSHRESLEPAVRDRLRGRFRVADRGPARDRCREFFPDAEPEPLRR